MVAARFGEVWKRRGRKNQRRGRAPGREGRSAGSGRRQGEGPRRCGGLSDVGEQGGAWRRGRACAVSLLCLLAEVGDDWHGPGGGLGRLQGFG